MMLSRTHQSISVAVRLSLASALCCAALVVDWSYAAGQSSDGTQLPTDGAAHVEAAHDHAQHSAGDSESPGQEEHQDHDHAASEGDEDPHAHHRAMMQQPGYQRSEHSYAFDDRKLFQMDGQATSLLAELDCGKPVMVNFIFTTCTTICPVMTGIFAQVQNELGPERDAVRMISVSIDPEYDTPERLQEYAMRFRAGPEWHFLTGNAEDVIAVQRAFEVYRGNKMSHQPVTLMRRAVGDPWVRMDGIASAAEIAAEYRQLGGG